MKILIISSLLLALISCSCLAEEPTITTPYGEAVRFDEGTATVHYYGWAYPGTGTGVSEWKMLRVTYTGNDWVEEWADGNTLYDNEWDNRATTVVYS